VLGLYVEGHTDAELPWFKSVLCHVVKFTDLTTQSGSLCSTSTVWQLFYIWIAWILLSVLNSDLLLQVCANMALNWKENCFLYILRTIVPEMVTWPQVCVLWPVSFQVYSVWCQSTESVDKVCVTFEQVVGVLFINLSAWLSLIEGKVISMVKHCVVMIWWYMMQWRFSSMQD